MIDRREIEKIISTTNRLVESNYKLRFWRLRTVFKRYLSGVHDNFTGMYEYSMSKSSHVEVGRQ